jgi:hypothetical protein
MGSKYKTPQDASSIGIEAVRREILLVYSNFQFSSC